MNPQETDGRLSALLRESRLATALPARFQDGVWRRIENAVAGRSVSEPLLLEALVAWMLRPKFALASVAALVLFGAALGVRQGVQGARQEAQARYIATVAPNVVH